MNKVIVPHLAALDALDLSSVGFLLESRAQREYINTINWIEYPYKPIVVFDIARSNTALYIRYFVKGNSLKATYGIDNSPVHTDSCVEFFMRKADETRYVNFEFNCIGTCDAAHRESRDIKNSFSQEEYAAIRRHTSLEMRPFEEMKGVYSWELIVCIPFHLMGLDPVQLPEKIMGNFYKCADQTECPHFVSWNPIDTPQPDFHRPECFGEIWL